MSVEEDYYLPVRQGSLTSIEALPGGQNAAAIDDVNYLRDKMFSAIKIPKSYLSQLEQMPEEKTTLAQKDIRFARTIQRLQRATITELEKIGIIHLYTLGYRGDDIISFDLDLNNPSRLAQLQEIEYLKSKFEAAGQATEGFFSRRWIAEHIFGMPHEEFLRNQRERFYDKKVDTAIEAAAQEPMFEAPGAGPAEEGAEAAGADMGAMPELGAPEEAPAEAPEAPAPEAEASPLLAEPGAAKREDGSIPVKLTYKDGTEMYMGAGKHKKYKPVELFKDKRKTAGRGKHYKYMSGKSRDLDRLARGVVESKETIYNNLESQLQSLTEEGNKIVDETEKNIDEIQA
tara:strand:- start:1999 stop:3030 length:1032 start_codon:yes stop_codon:yes gene_type:complete